MTPPPSSPAPTPPPYLQPYRRSLAEHGSNFEVTLWASKRSQELRFGVFNEMAFLGGKHLLDAGCARGDLAEYLLRQHVEYGQYVGLDAMAELVQFARSRGLPRTQFHHGDIVADPAVLATGAPQVILISGTLNTMCDDQVQAVLAGAWRATSQSLLFNFLSARCGPHSPRQEPPVRRLDPAVLLDWAWSQTSQVAFRQDYFPHSHDATIMMTKP